MDWSRAAPPLLLALQRRGLKGHTAAPELPLFPTDIFFALLWHVKLSVSLCQLQARMPASKIRAAWSGKVGSCVSHPSLICCCMGLYAVKTLSFLSHGQQLFVKPVYCFTKVTPSPRLGDLSKSWVTESLKGPTEALWLGLWSCNPCWQVALTHAVCMNRSVPFTEPHS